MEAAEFAEVASARCDRCGAEANARDFSAGAYEAWPVAVERGRLSALAPHAGCGGAFVPQGVTSISHICPDGCECQTGGLQDRVTW